MKYRHSTLKFFVFQLPYTTQEFDRKIMFFIFVLGIYDQGALKQVRYYFTYI